MVEDRTRTKRADADENRDLALVLLDFVLDYHGRTRDLRPEDRFQIRSEHRKWATSRSTKTRHASSNAYQRLRSKFRI